MTREFRPEKMGGDRCGAEKSLKGIGDVGKLKDVLHVVGLVFDLVSESWCDKKGMQGHWGGQCSLR